MDGSADWLVLLYTLGTWSCALLLFVQVDAKRWIALYSLSHVQLWYAILCYHTQDGTGVDRLHMSACLNAMYVHSLTSAALFLLVGWFVDQFGSRAVAELRACRVWTYRWYLLLFLLANGGYPLFALFTSELVLLSGAWLYAHPAATFLLLVTSLLPLLSGLLVFSNASVSTLAAPVRQHPWLTQLCAVLLL